MKYYLIAGEASGDLHASRLMKALSGRDAKAEFRFIGGALMRSAGGTMAKDYRELAYMGFIPVLLHLPAIVQCLSSCKKDIARWRPDAVILVDYPGFNLRIAKFVHSQLRIPVFYYISPKLWAWKEWRIKNIKRDVDRLFSILPFEKDFYEGRHGYPISYVGNPTVGEILSFKKEYSETRSEYCRRHGLDASRPIVALLPGSRKQEIKDNLPAMLRASRDIPGCTRLLACAPGLSSETYAPHITGGNVCAVANETYETLSHADAAIVTSGTATLETALFGVPQIVCYKTPLPRLIGWLRRKVLSVRYISLVNLIADSDVVPELVAESFSVDNIEARLRSILPGGEARQAMLKGYEKVARRLGRDDAADKAASQMAAFLERQQH